MCIPMGENSEFEGEAREEAEKIKSHTDAYLHEGTTDQLRDYLLENGESIEFIHFIGHGGSKVYGHEFLDLALCDQYGNKELLKNKNVIDMISSHCKKLKFVFFNACSTADIAASMLDGYKHGENLYALGWGTKVRGDAAGTSSTRPPLRGNTKEAMKAA